MDFVTNYAALVIRLIHRGQANFQTFVLKMQYCHKGSQWTKEKNNQMTIEILIRCKLSNTYTYCSLRLTCFLIKCIYLTLECKFKHGDKKNFCQNCSDKTCSLVCFWLVLIKKRSQTSVKSLFCQKVSAPTAAVMHQPINGERREVKATPSSASLRRVLGTAHKMRSN